MGRVEVSYAKYPEHAEEARRWAHDDSPPDGALLDKRQWEAIKSGQRPPKARSHGLGDTAAKFTKAIGFKPCPKCNWRRRMLNKLVPYRKWRG